MMVLHHLPKVVGNEVDFSPVAQTISSAAAALKENGVFVLGFQTPIQTASYWFSQIVPKNCQKVCSRCPTIEFIKECFAKEKLEVKAIFNIMLPLTGETYYDAESLLTDEMAWAQDSIMSAADSSEIEKAKEMLQRLQEQGKLEQYVQENDRIPIHGSGTIIAAVRA